jgi:hypothetical protein
MSHPPVLDFDFPRDDTLHTTPTHTTITGTCHQHAPSTTTSSSFIIIIIIFNKQHETIAHHPVGPCLLTFRKKSAAAKFMAKL